MPAATAFYDKYGDHRDKFEIFAFHSASAKTFEELDAKMESIIEKTWRGRELPFPILLDATGETLRKFSIKALGTHVLIDPDGKVVKGNGIKTLEAGVKKLIERSEKQSRKKSRDSQTPMQYASLVPLAFALIAAFPTVSKSDACVLHPVSAGVPRAGASTILYAATIER